MRLMRCRHCAELVDANLLPSMELIPDPDWLFTLEDDDVPEAACPKCGEVELLASWAYSTFYVPDAPVKVETQAELF
jgi:hypothetical protein